MVIHIKEEYLNSIVTGFESEHPGAQVPKELKDLVQNAQDKLSVFEEGPERKLKIWNRFRDFLHDNEGQMFDTEEDFYKAAHSYIEDGCYGTALTEAEKEYLTLSNYEMNNKVRFGKFLKEYRSEGNHGGIKDFFRKFREAKAKANEGSFKQFLSTEYPNAATELRNSIVKAEHAAEGFDAGMVESLGTKVDIYDAKIADVKNLEKELFGNTAGKTALKVGLISVGLGLAFLGARWVYNQIKHENRRLAHSTNPQQQQPQPTVSVTDTIAEEQVVDSTALVQDAATEDTTKVQLQQEPIKDTVVEPQAESVETEVVENNNSAEESENGMPQMPNIIVMPINRDSAKVEQSVYTPEAPYPYTMETPSVEEKTEVKEETKPTEAEPSKEAPVAAATREQRSMAFNQAINKIKATLTIEGIECDSYTVVKNDTLWKIAASTLKAEGISKPSSQDISKRIALIALLNDIEDINKLYINQTLKIPSAALNAYIEANSELSELLNILAREYA